MSDRVSDSTSDARPMPPALVTLSQAQTRYPAVAMTLAHWDGLRAGRAMPARDEIDPRALAHALEFMFVAEPVAPGVARLRLAGQHLTHLLGMEPRGMPLCALFDATSRNELADAVTQVTRGALRVLLPLRAPGALGRPQLDGLMALMPLQDGQGQAVRILGVLQTRGAIGRTPRKLALTGPAECLETPRKHDGRPDRLPFQVISGGLA